MSLKRYIRDDGFDFPDKTMEEMISDCFKTINNKLNIKRGFLYVASNYMHWYLEGKYFPALNFNIFPGS